MKHEENVPMNDLPPIVPSRKDLLSRWPKDPSGVNEQAVFLANLPDAGGIADMSCTLLEAYGIPVVKKYWDGGSMGRIVLGFSGYGVDLYVPASQLEEARQLLDSAPGTQEPDQPEA